MLFIRMLFNLDAIFSIGHPHETLFHLYSSRPDTDFVNPLELGQGDKNFQNRRYLQTDLGKMQECTLLGILGTADTIYLCYLI